MALDTLEIKYWLHTSRKETTIGTEKRKYVCLFNKPIWHLNFIQNIADILKLKTKWKETYVDYYKSRKENKNN